jgi:uncharacterized protein YjbJ (UPF0337 family)
VVEAEGKVMEAQGKVGEA